MSHELGAIRARLDVYHARIDLMRAIGVLPRDLGYIGVAIDLQRIGDRLVEVFRQSEIPATTKEQIMDAISPPAAVVT